MSLYARRIAEAMHARGGLQVEQPAAFALDVQRFAPMHDIGKAGMPDAILLEPACLDEGERATMNQRTLIGGRALRACAMQLPHGQRRAFQTAAEIAESHHERCDGSGYARRRRGDAIPLAARPLGGQRVLRDG